MLQVHHGKIILLPTPFQSSQFFVQIVIVMLFLFYVGKNDVLYYVYSLELEVDANDHYVCVFAWPGVDVWSSLTVLRLWRCHAIRLYDFCEMVPMLSSLKSLQLEYMFREPPKGCSRWDNLPFVFFSILFHTDHNKYTLFPSRVKCMN